jgi:hypothetical protein
MTADDTAAKVAAIATRQHGIATRAQLRDAGWSDGQIDNRLARGYLIPVRRGVLAVGHGSLTQHSQWIAAVLCAGPRAVLSHRSAAALWGLSSGRPEIEVTRPSNGCHRRGLTVHSTRFLPEAHRTKVDGIPVTTVARTLIDIAATESPRALDDRLSAARRLGRLDCGHLRRTIESMPSRAGLPELSARLKLFERYRAVTRSELETRFLRLCAEAGIPLPEADVELGAIVVDFLWRSQRLIVELDSHQFHRHRFDEDRGRDLGNLVNGYRTVRVTYRMMETESGRLVASLRRLLAQ